MPVGRNSICNFSSRPWSFNFKITAIEDSIFFVAKNISWERFSFWNYKDVKAYLTFALL